MSPCSPTTHAVLLEWSAFYIGDECSISIAPDSSALFEQIKDNIIGAMDILIDQHYDEIYFSDLNVIYEGFVDEDNPCPEDFGTDDVRELLVQLIQEQSANLKKNPSALTIKGPWYDLIEYLNDEMHGDHCYISSEGRLPLFSSELIEWIKAMMPNPDIISIQEGRWICTLRNIFDDDQWWERTDMKNLGQVINEFNDRYKFV